MTSDDNRVYGMSCVAAMRPNGSISSSYAPQSYGLFVHKIRTSTLQFSFSITLCHISYKMENWTMACIPELNALTSASCNRLTLYTDQTLLYWIIFLFAVVVVVAVAIPAIPPKMKKLPSLDNENVIKFIYNLLICKINRI